MSMKPKRLTRPVKLNPDNFTPLTRTPWAGSQIANTIKKRFVDKSQSLIGESWEFSCDPQFPSYVESDRNLTLTSITQRFPAEIFGASEQNPCCEILIKLIEAGSPLSLQVHPEDNDPNLQSDECGKPESWYVLSAAPGAGIYLGFREAIDKDELREKLHAFDDIENLLQFVPVKPGDYFEIKPGVPHAIGPQVMLLEPQRIRRGLSGKTYRMWDWNRLYDANGQIDMERGHARPLHIEEAINIIQPNSQFGMDFVESLRRTPNRSTIGPGIVCDTFPKNQDYQLHIITAETASTIRLNQDTGYAALLMLSGSLYETSAEKHQANDSRIDMGECALLPHAAFPQKFMITENSQLAIVIPRQANLIIQ